MIEWNTRCPKDTFCSPNDAPNIDKAWHKYLPTDEFATLLPDYLIMRGRIVDLRLADVFIGWGARGCFDQKELLRRIYKCRNNKNEEEEKRRWHLNNGDYWIGTTHARWQWDKARGKKLWQNEVLFSWQHIVMTFNLRKVNLSHKLMKKR